MMTYVFIYSVVAIKADFTKLLRSKDQKMILIGSDYCLDRLTPENKSCFTAIHRLSTRDFHEVNAEEVEAFLLPYIKSSGAENIMLLTNEDSTQLTLAKLREKYGIPGVGYDQVLPFVDKVVSKERLGDAVRVPKFVKFDKTKYLEDKENYLDFIIKTLGFPMFAKPIDLASSIETHYIPMLFKLESVAERILESKYEFEIDEYIDHDLYNCDALVFNKQIKAFIVGKYIYVPAMFQKGFPIPILQVNDERIIEKLQQLCNTILLKLGFFSGFYHLEAFYDKKHDEFVFLEISPRTGGALIPNMWEKHYGIHTEEYHYLSQMNLINYINLESKNIFSASITFPKRQGEVASIIEPKIDIEHKFESFARSGDTLVRGENLLDMSASIIFWDKSYEKVYNTIEILKNFNPLNMVSTVPTLEQTDNIIKILFDVIPHIFWKDINGIYHGGNHNEAIVFGFKSPQDFIGKNIYELIQNHTEASIIDDNDNMVMLEDRTRIVEEKITKVDGTSIYYSQKSPIHDDYGRVIGMLGFSMDITDIRKKEEESRKIINLLFDSIPFVFWKDANGIYQGANMNEAIVLGLKSPNDIIGKTSFDITKDQKAAKQVVENDNKVMRENCSMTVEETINGKTYFSQKTPIHDGHGNVTGMLGFSMDITEHKKMEEKLRAEKEQAEFTLTNIINLVSAHVYWKDKNGVYLGCNDAQVKSWGLSSSRDVIGKTDLELPGGNEYGKEFMANDQTVMRTGNLVITEEAALVNGQPSLVLSQKIPLRNQKGEIDGIIGISMDISERKKIEKELIEAISEKEAILLSDTIKTQFMQNMEHDLRTPASGVAQMLHILSGDETDPNKKDTLQKLATASQRLLDLLNDIITFDKSSSGQLAVLHYRFDLYDVVQSIVDMETPTAQSKNIALKVEIDSDVPQYIVGDRNRIYRILLNLVGNAVKFTTKGYVKIAISRGKKIDAKRFILKIVVEDTGIGISENKRKIIYEKFERGSPSNRGLYKGAGLGLSITKQFIDELQGEIEVESAQDVGTTFTCLIPCSLTLMDIADYSSIYDKFQVLRTPQAPTETQGKKAEENAALDTKFNHIHILVVEDDQMAQLAARSILEGKFGTDFTLAKTGQEALNLTEKNKYDIIFMDLGLPDIIGTDVTKKIRETDKATPIIALTAHDKKEMRDACRSVGMDDFLVKPLNIEKSQAVLQKWLRKEKFAFELAQIEEPTISNEQILDFELCKKIANNNENIAKQLWQVFSGLLPQYLANIEDAFNKGDAFLLFNHAHKLKGASMYAGASKLSAAAAPLCEALRPPKKPKMQKVKKPYENLCAVISETIRKYAELGY